MVEWSLLISEIRGLNPVINNGIECYLYLKLNCKEENKYFVRLRGRGGGQPTEDSPRLFFWQNAGFSSSFGVGVVDVAA